MFLSSSNCRYKLCICAGDETGDTDFIVFGRMAQRLIKKTPDTLIAENPRGFIPDEITRLLEKTFVWNVSFTENTIASGNVCFQVNAVVGEINDGNTLVPVTPVGSQTSSVMLSQGDSSSIQATPRKNDSSTAMLTAELPVTPQSRRTTAHDEVSNLHAHLLGQDTGFLLIF